jgi:hypothetical protein
VGSQEVALVNLILRGLALATPHHHISSDKLSAKKELNLGKQFVPLVASIYKTKDTP